MSAEEVISMLLLTFWPVVLIFGIWLAITLLRLPWMLISLTKKARLYDVFKNQIDSELRKIEERRRSQEQALENKRLHLESHHQQREKSIQDKENQTNARIKECEEGLKKLVAEKTTGFPWLANAYADYLHLLEMKDAESLRRKKNPAKKASENVREIAHQRRDAEKKLRVFEYQIQYYESLFPWLTEFKNEEIAEELIRIESTKTQDPERDGALSWLSEGEYKSLPSREKFQLALERYWKRKKTKFEVGRDYERYIGWTYEKNGYEVYYQGIIKGFDDLGRDLIVTKGKEVIVVQCKYWARDKTIHEKHVFQLYGTMTSHQIENPSLKVSGRFVTSTGLSDRAKKFSDHLGIKISENTRLEEYPCIKCNIAGRDGEKIYHLPFDQQYDTTKIEPEKGEFYCRSVAEAEEKGFRRAMRYRGL